VPRKLLKIESRDGEIMARLVEPVPHPSVRWAALSYVWGGDQVIKTTVASISTMDEPFAVRSLPQTLQDAFAVCTKIGLHYLWIDCLCIVQDDPYDLASELDSMPQIYQLAWVTISASTADHVSTGFLHDRGHRVQKFDGKDYRFTKLVAPTISLLYACKNDDNTGAIILKSRHDTIRIANDEADVYAVRQKTLPIHRRAWYVKFIDRL
jgi:hypothetical protein